MCGGRISTRSIPSAIGAPVEQLLGPRDDRPRAVPPPDRGRVGGALSDHHADIDAERGIA